MTPSLQKAMALNCDHAGERLQRYRDVPDKRICSSLKHGDCDDVDLMHHLNGHDPHARCTGGDLSFRQAIADRSTPLQWRLIGVRAP